MSRFVRRQIMKKLDFLISTGLDARATPSKGWIKTIREALYISTYQLSKKMKTSQTSIIRYEQGESAGSISLKKLKSVAAALDCQLVYFFVPHKDLEKMIDDQAYKKAKQILYKLESTMALEDQSVSEEEGITQLKEVAEDLKRNPRKLWEDDV